MLYKIFSNHTKPINIFKYTVFSRTITTWNNLPPLIPANLQLMLLKPASIALLPSSIQTDTMPFYIPARMHFAAPYHLQSTYTAIICLHFFCRKDWP